MATINVDTIIGIPVVLPRAEFLGNLNTVSSTGFGNPTIISIDYDSAGRYLIASGAFTAGTTTPTEAKLTLPFGLTNALPDGRVVGNWWRAASSASTRKRGNMVATPGAPTLVYFCNDDYTTAWAANNSVQGNAMLGSGEVLYFEYRIPISGWSTMLAYGMGRAQTFKDGTVAPRGGQYGLTITGTGWTATRAVGIYYQDQAGAHRLKFNIVGAIASVTQSTYQCYITGITSKNIGSFHQGVSCTANTPTVLLPCGAFILTNSNQILIYHTSNSITQYSISGDIELESKPSWAA